MHPSRCLNRPAVEESKWRTRLNCPSFRFPLFCPLSLQQPLGAFPPSFLPHRPRQLLSSSFRVSVSTSFVARRPEGPEKANRLREVRARARRTERGEEEALLPKRNSALPPARNEQRLRVETKIVDSIAGRPFSCRPGNCLDLL